MPSSARRHCHRFNTSHDGLPPAAFFRSGGQTFERVRCEPGYFFAAGALRTRGGVWEGRKCGKMPVDAIAEIGRAHAELQSLMHISYAVFCLKNKKATDNNKSKND